MGIIIGTLTAIGFFNLGPDFQITEYPHKNVTQSTLEIANSGWTQAVNPQITIVANASMTVSNSHCREGIFVPSNDSAIQLIKFDRFSTRLTCSIDFQRAESTGIKEITISSDGTKGWQFYPQGPHVDEFGRNAIDYRANPWTFNDFLLFFFEFIFAVILLGVSPLIYLAIRDYRRKEKIRLELSHTERDIVDELYRLQEIKSHMTSKASDVMAHKEL